MTLTQPSPFKLLDAYTKSDHRFFFGRKKEVDTLYDYVNKNRFVIIYGPSGTGKTSLVECGLANRFDATEWLPFLIRRTNNIVDSLERELGKNKVLQNYKVPAAYTGNPLLDKLDRLSKHYLRRVFLIFDQFEEMLILGSEAEIDSFLSNIKDIISSEVTQSCSILLLLREEYFARLDHLFQKKNISDFSNRRLRVEPMLTDKAEEVIINTCDYFNMKLQNPSGDAAEIITSISTKTGISLPYLQVYLDQLWRKGFAKQYPDGYNGTGHPALHFTSTDIRELGQREVLERFLTERRDSIQQDVNEKFPGSAPDTVHHILDAFVTDDGTKLPLHIISQNETQLILKNVPEYLQKLPADLLRYCLKELDKNRLLRNDGESYELAHGSLAALIDQQRTTRQRRINSLRRQIQLKYETFLETQEYLSYKEVNLYEDYIPELSLDEKYIQFFEQSKDFRENELNREMLEAKNNYKREKKYRRLTTWGSLAFIIICLVSITYISINYKDLAQQKARTEEQRRMADSLRLQFQKQRDRAIILEDSASKALTAIQKAEYDKVMADVMEMLARAEKLKNSSATAYQGWRSKSIGLLKSYEKNNPYIKKSLDSLSASMYK